MKQNIETLSSVRYADGEIKMIYRQAKNKKQQIKILADLNCCSVKAIKEIIGIQEEVMDEIKTKINWDAIFTELDNGEDIDVVATKYGTPTGTISRERSRRSALENKKESDLSNTAISADKKTSREDGMCDYVRMQAITDLIRTDDDPRVKNRARELIVALARQGSGRALGIISLEEIADSELTVVHSLEG